MKSQVAARLKLKYDPVAVLFTQEKPDQALEFAEEKWGCAAAMLTAAMKGKTIAFSRKTFGCLGGGVGLGFGDQYVHFPGGITHFLSTGRGEGYPPGEAYKKTPELAQSFVDSLPMTDIPAEFVVLKPLSAVEPAVETPQVVVFYANPDQLSALVVLTNYGRVGCNNVTIPFAAGCQSTCLLPLAESQQREPRAVVGMTDISARPVIDADLLSFSVPWSLYQELEQNAAGSFLDKEAWHKVVRRIPDR